jgi:hypothetical protein
MLFILLLSVLQICFIPGFIFFIFLYRRSKNPPVLLMPVYSFALSLVINYIIVLLLTYFHIYTRWVLIIILALELIFLVAVYIFRGLNIRVYNCKMAWAEISDEINLFISSRKSSDGLIKFILLILSVLLLIAVFVVLILNIGKVFNAWDAVFSWNKWALEFFNNKMPTVTWHYPQLIPANWSVSYVLIGYPLQFISRGIMPLFLLLMIYSFIILGVKQESAIFLFSSFFLFLGLNRLNWTDGVVEAPVAFFSILVFICLSFMAASGDDDKKRYIISGTLFACASAVTKQAGIFTLLIYPVLLMVLTKDNFDWTFKRLITFSCFYLAMILLIVLPFYLHVEMAIRNGTETSEVSFVTHDIYNGATYPERLKHAFWLFANVFSNRLVFIPCIILFLISFADSRLRLFNFAFIIPYFFIWALFFSYDLRNVAIIIPYFCLGIGAGFDMILKRTVKHE